MCEVQQTAGHVERGSPDSDLSGAGIKALFSGALAEVLEDIKPSGGVLIIPPDITRFHSRGGLLACAAAEALEKRKIRFAVLPALGTHRAMSAAETRRMFPGIPEQRFLVHDWRNGPVELGRLEADWVAGVTEGAVRFDWPVQVNRLLRDGGAGLGGPPSLIISIGQVVPHEVTGMSGHGKNILVGCGGKEAIDRSHFAGALYGMERILGRTDTPVRRFFDEGIRRFGGLLPPVFWALTVLSPKSAGERAAAGGTAPGRAAVQNAALEEGGDNLAVRGLYTGFGRDCFEKAAALARRVNVELLEEPVQKAVVYLDPEEFRSTWLGNKAVYRLRMAMAGGGELVILAPGLERFGEDGEIDALIRKHGYRPAAEIQERTAKDEALGSCPAAAAHLIHGSPEGRFTVRYCPGTRPGGPSLSRGEIESVGYEWGDLDEALARYGAPETRPGWNIRGGERFFYAPNPALGLWAAAEKAAGLSDG
ncbi:MAG: lactate racemase domain-containing protein [Treponema sp.]|jgi:nickel-dependent lactate racemase|nr:lactate racemase domain-containing protein [Treponema sp.]